MATLLILTSGLLTAFLYPRTVTVQVIGSNATKLGNDSFWNFENNQTYDVMLGIEASLSAVREDRVCR